MSGGSLNYWNADEPINIITDRYLFGKNKFEESTLKEFRNAINILRKAEIYAHRIEWLLSGDDGEESFHKRLKEDLKELEKESSKEIPCLEQNCKYCEHFYEFDKKCEYSNGYNRWYDSDDIDYHRKFMESNDATECWDFSADYDKKYELLQGGE